MITIQFNYFFLEFFNVQKVNNIDKVEQIYKGTTKQPLGAAVKDKMHNVLHKNHHV